MDNGERMNIAIKQDGWIDRLFDRGKKNKISKIDAYFITETFKIRLTTSPNFSGYPDNGFSYFLPLLVIFGLILNLYF